jgi:hypothetical protein
MATLGRLALVAAVITSGGAVTGNAEDGPTTRGVQATLEARRVEVHAERYCQGADGLYRFAHETYEGTSTGDPELTGRFVLEIHAADNVSQGFLGLATGKARIFDAATGRLKVMVDVSAIDSPSLDPLGVKVDGFVSGHVLPDPADPSGSGRPTVLFANFSVRLDTTAAFVGNLGGDGPVAPRNTAVIQDAADACRPDEGTQ